MRHRAVRFDDNRDPVPPTEFEYPGEPDAEEDPPRSDRSAAERMVKLLGWITQGGEVGDAGRRAILLAFLLRLHGAPRSVRELGARLGVSHVTAWRLCNRIRSEIARFSRE